MNNKQPWQQTAPLTSTDIKQLLHDNFAQLSIKSISMLGEGWDNTTWLVNKALVFRLPKHEEAATLICNEMRVLSCLPDLGVNVPTPRYVCIEPKGFSHPFYGHPLISGKTADRSELTDTNRAQLAVPIARFLKTLHTTPIKQVEKLGIGYDRLGRVEIAGRIEKVKERLSYLIAHNVIGSAESFLAQYQQHIDLKIPQEWVLAHGDFYARHLILDDNKQLSGVIDWGDSELVHPAVDLAIVYQFLPHESHETFWHEYGQVSETTKIIATLRAIYSAVTMGWYAHQVSDKALLSESIKALARIEALLVSQ